MSSFPHYNALASTLISTSPTSGLESLISRARTHPNARPHQASPPNGGTRSPAGNHRRPRRLSSSSTAEDEESMLFDETAPLTQNYGALAARRPSHASSTRSGRVGGQEIHLPGIFEPHVLTVEQGGETAEEEEERILGHASTEDESRDWRAMVKMESKVLLYSMFPVLLSQMAEYSLIVASIISIGHLSSGATDLAAASLASMTSSVVSFSVLQGLASALDTLLPSAWTSDDPTRVGLWSQRVAVVISAACVPMLYIFWSSEGILLFLRQEPDVAAKAAQYLHYLSISIPAYGGNCIMKKYFQAQGLMNVPTIVVFVVAPWNIFLNWLLVWGPIPALRLGFPGAPLATAISINLEFALFILYAAFISDGRAWGGFSVDKAFSKLGTTTKLGLSGVGMVASEWWSWEIVTLAASQLGATALATQSILLISCSITYQVPFSLAIATSVRVGNLLGAGRGWAAMISSMTSVILAVCFSGIGSSALMILRYKFAYLFNSDPDVVAGVAAVIPWVALFQVSDGLSGVAGGIMRAVGKQSTGAIINLSGYYVFGLPIGLYLCFQGHRSLEGLWIGLSIALAYAAFFENLILYRVNWHLEVERARERLGLGTKDGHGDRDVRESGPLLSAVEELDEGAGLRISGASSTSNGVGGAGTPR